MPKDFTSTTFSEIYRDDYADSDNYYRILFNSGRPLQARELTQLQTILQEQISRFGNNIFLDGAAVSSAGANVQTSDYIILNSLPSGVNAKDYIGVMLQGPPTASSAGLQFLVTHAEEATDDGDFPTLYGSYRSYNQAVTNQDVQDQTLTFAEDDELQDIRVISGLEGQPNVVVRTQPGGSQISSIGEGLLFSCQSGSFWTQGFFVFAEKQTITISKYDATADVDVGFEVKQDIVTVDDTDDLYDNQGAVPNLSSPGADRYRIRLILTERGAVDNPYKFVFFASVRNGEITQVRGGSDSFNQVEKRMAVRQFDTNGDFIANPFDIQYKPGDSAEGLLLEVKGNVQGLNPIAFVDGYRLQLFNDTRIKVPRATSHTTEEGTNLTVAYRNYVNVAYDSNGTDPLSVWNNNYTLADQKKYDILDQSGTAIGSTRIKHIQTSLDDSEGYRVHLYDVEMNPTENFRRGIKLRPHNDAGEGINLVLRSDELYAQGTSINRSLQLVPGGRVKSVYNLNYSVQRQFAATVVAGEVSITTNANESFDNIAQWIFINTTNHTTETVPVTSVVLSSSDPQTADCPVSGSNGDAYTVLAYVQKNSPQPRLKTYTKSSTVSAARDGDDFYFDLYDGISAMTVRADSANGRDVSEQVRFDGGQRDNYYGKIRLIDDGLSNSVNSLYATFEHFDWGASGDYFAVNSYQLTDSFPYNRIPTFVSPRDGADYPLRNYLDFRPKLDTTANSMNASDRFETVRDGDNISYDVQWYNPRIDNIAIGYNRSTFEPEIRVNRGEESMNPIPPKPKNSEMVLFQVVYGGKTLNVKDITTRRMRHKRYRMKDIDDLKKRVDTLEETVSLSFLEQNAINLVELDGEGNVRSKTGMFIDDFKQGFDLSASEVSPQYQFDDRLTNESILQVGQTQWSMQPRMRTTSVQMLYDSDNTYTGRTGMTKSNVVRKGDIVYLDYREVLDSSFVNEVISWYSDGRSSEEQGWYNVNPFNVFSGEGLLKLSPQSDVWSDTYHLPDLQEVTEVFNNNDPGKPGSAGFSLEEGDNNPMVRGSAPQAPAGPPWEGPPMSRDPETGLYPMPPGTGTITPNMGTSNNGDNWVWTSTTTTTTTTTIDRIEEEVMAYAVPFCRQREVFAKVQGLRPNTRYWPFFDGVNVEQWVLKETQEEYRTHMRNDDHLRGYPEVDVTVKKHPRAIDPDDHVLISDFKGDMFFSFWLPNNAPVPSPNGNGMNTFEEWENWVEQQELEAANYPDGVDDPRVYDDIGWKFKTGTIPFLLNDVSSNEPKSGLSFALSSYTAAGTLNVSQKTTYMTRTTTTTTTWKYENIDPLAQSFYVDPREGMPGLFVTKIDVFLRRTPQSANKGGSDLAIPIQLQIREMENGTPLGVPAGDQYRVYKSADECFDIVNNISNKDDLDEVLSNPVTFEFEEPVYLSAGEEYAICLLSECDDYEAYISTTYGLVLGKTEERVSSQPASGSLFLSQNGSTWTPRQDQNMAYRIHTAKFLSEGSLNFYNDELPYFKHNTARFTADSDDLSRLRVNQIGHGLGIGDKPYISGLDSTQTYNGVLGSTIMNPSLTVDEADVAGYFVNVGDSFDGADFFGTDSAQSYSAFNFDEFVWSLMTQEYPTTTINYLGSMISGYSYSQVDLTATADPRFDFTDLVPLRPEIPRRLNKPRMIGTEEMERNEVTPFGPRSPSLVIGAKMESKSVSTFGGPKAASVRPLGYTADVSPIIDLTRNTFKMKNFLIDNQPETADVASEATNVPHYYLTEETNVGGTSPSKHLTKPVVLGNTANGLRVYLNAYVPPAAELVLYYRTTADADDDIYDEAFTLALPEYSPPADPFSAADFDVLKLPYSEYSYLIGGVDGDLPDFTKFQLKIVMKSKNTCATPIISAIRAIAVV